MVDKSLEMYIEESTKAKGNASARGGRNGRFQRRGNFNNKTNRFVNKQFNDFEGEN